MGNHTCPKCGEPHSIHGYILADVDETPGHYKECPKCHHQWEFTRLMGHQPGRKARFRPQL